MTDIKNRQRKFPFPETLFFLFIFFLSIVPLRDFDIWFHIKSGEIMSKMGIIHKDIFSYTAQGREWFPHEWIFQIGTYFLQQTFGFESIKYVMAVAVTVLIGIIYLILRKIIELNRTLSMCLSFFFFVSIYEFFTARPHVFAYLFLLANLYIILLYFQKNKNYLWLSIPVTLLWANLHSSIFLSPGFFAAYAFLSLVNYYLSKRKLSNTNSSHKTIKPFNHTDSKVWLFKFRILSIYTVVTAVLTVLPPLGINQYRLLWIFFWDRQFISQFISEWLPIIALQYSFLFFTGTVILVFTLFILKVYRSPQKPLWILPLLPFIALAYMASRNVFFGYITLTLLFAWSIKEINFQELSKLKKIIFASLILFIVCYHFYIVKEKKTPERFYYPVKAVDFIKKYDLSGNMFNEYAYGGYLLYHLYPERKVYIDGRTDIYLCCEMRDVLDLSLKKNAPDKDYKAYLDKIWAKNDVSYVFFRTQKHTILRRIGTILMEDPNWSLVYWDDDTILFVRRDGKNDHILKQFQTSAATPYERDPYRKGMEEKALEEYQRMIRVADSAKSRNAIGYIYLRQKKYEEAKAEFEKATLLDPSNESPYMNLAELSAASGDLKTAMHFYESAQKLAPDRGLIYIRLGQLTLEETGDLDKAKQIWEKGLKKTVDTEAKDKLKSLLEN